MAGGAEGAGGGGAAEPAGPTLADLPEGVGLRVLEQLPPEALAAASMACRSWRRLGGDALLWRRHCEAAGFVGAAGAAGPGPASPGFEDEGYRLKQEFGQRWIWRRRWLAGRWRSLRLEQHSDWVISVGLLHWPRAVAQRAAAALGPEWAVDFVNWGVGGAEGTGGAGNARGGGGEAREGSAGEAAACSASREPHSGMGTGAGAGAGGPASPLDPREVEEFIVSIGDEQECFLWNLREGVCLGSLPCPDAASLLPERQLSSLGPQGAFDFSDEVLCQVGEDGQTVEVWRAGGELLGALEGHTRRVDVVEMGPRGLVASGGKDACLHVWRVESPRPRLHHAVQTGASVKCILWRSATSLVAGLYDGRLVHFDPLGRQEIGSLQAHGGPVMCLQALESWVVSGSRDGSVVVTCPDTLARLFCLEGHTAPVCCLFCTPYCVLSGSKDKTVRVWEVRSRPAGAEGGAEEAPE